MIYSHKRFSESFLKQKNWLHQILCSSVPSSIKANNDFSPVS
ncbi:hypothetical protein B4113_3281 [Geobacillus sp. B4113_201601]|nr:hypothetical protein B4113_3281 [Geobacillus sp. B4113_201601]